jgi:hypothetical protein
MTLKTPLLEDWSLTCWSMLDFLSAFEMIFKSQKLTVIFGTRTCAASISSIQKALPPHPRILKTLVTHLFYDLV